MTRSMSLELEELKKNKGNNCRKYVPSIPVIDLVTNQKQQESEEKQSINNVDTNIYL